MAKSIFAATAAAYGARPRVALTRENLGTAHAAGLDAISTPHHCRLTRRRGVLLVRIGRV